MSRGNFIEVMEQFADQAKSKKLYKKAEGLYLMRSFKITNISSYQSIKSYERLSNKYETFELKVDPNDWHKNERKLFIWYLICYCEQKRTAIQDLTDYEWNEMGNIFFNKNPQFLKFQGLSILKNTRRHNWTPQDDQTLKRFVTKIDTNQWNLISKSIFFENDCGTFISAKQCRERWFNHICQKVNKSQWTHQQNIKILNLTLTMGKKWSAIARQLNTNRTEHMVKNRFNSIINKIRRKKLQNQSDLTRKAILLLEKENSQGLLKNQMKEIQEQQKPRSCKSANIIQITSLTQKRDQQSISNSAFKRPQLKQKQSKIQQIHVNELPEGDIKDYLKLNMATKMGCIILNSNDTIYEGQANDNLAQILFLMTPSVKAISPGLTNPFRNNFEGFMRSFDKREDGSSLFSPANNYSPGPPGFHYSLSPYPFVDRQMMKQQKTATNTSSTPKSLIDPIGPSFHSDLSCQYKKITQ